MRRSAFLLLAVFVVGGAAAAVAAAGDVPRSRLPRVTADTWVVFDGVGVSCLGIDARGKVPGARGIVCFPEKQARFSYRSPVAAIFAFSWESKAPSRIDLGSFSAFLSRQAFHRLHTHDLHVPLLGAVTMPGTNIVCQSLTVSPLDGHHPGIWCLITSPRTVVGSGGMTHLATSVAHPTGDFDKTLDAVRVNGASGFLLDSKLVGAIKIPKDGPPSLVITHMR